MAYEHRIMIAFHISPMTAFHPDIEVLRAEAAAGGFRFVDKLIDDWRSGTNKFDQPGELFLGAFRESRLLGFCGLNHDPYKEQNGVGRLRHLYVRRDARREGVASALVGFILDQAKGVFQLIRLRTDTLAAAEFYTQLGFKSVNDVTASHVMFLAESTSEKSRRVAQTRSVGLLRKMKLEMAEDFTHAALAYIMPLDKA